HHRDLHSFPTQRSSDLSAMPMEQARRLCPPSTVVVVPRFAAYSAYSARIMAALREVTDLVEPVSIDEAFADVAGAVGPETDLGRDRKSTRLNSSHVKIS